MTLDEKNWSVAESDAGYTARSTIAVKFSATGALAESLALRLLLSRCAHAHSFEMTGVVALADGATAHTIEVKGEHESLRYLAFEMNDAVNDLIKLTYNRYGGSVVRAPTGVEAWGKLASSEVRPWMPAPGNESQTLVYQPSPAHMPQDMPSFEVFSSLEAGRFLLPEVPENEWLAVHFSDIENAVIVDAAKPAREVRLSGMTVPQGNEFRRLVERAQTLGARVSLDLKHWCGPGFVGHGRFSGVGPRATEVDAWGDVLEGLCLTTPGRLALTSAEFGDVHTANVLAPSGKLGMSTRRLRLEVRKIDSHYEVLLVQRAYPPEQEPRDISQSRLGYASKPTHYADLAAAAKGIEEYIYGYKDAEAEHRADVLEHQAKEDRLERGLPESDFGVEASEEATPAPFDAKLSLLEAIYHQLNTDSDLETVTAAPRYELLKVQLGVVIDELGSGYVSPEQLEQFQRALMVHEEGGDWQSVLRQQIGPYVSQRIPDSPSLEM